MNRRDTVIGLLAFGTVPLATFSQSAPPLRVGWLSSQGFDDFFRSFVEGMAALGYVRGKNLVIEDRVGASVEAVERDAAELAALKPLAIVTAGTAARTAAKTAASVPVVFGFSGNPVDAGLSTDFARPDRNMTGVSFMALDLVGKRIELLKEMLPSLRRLAVLSNQLHAGEPREYAVTREAADRLGIALTYIPFKGASEIETALATAIAARTDAGVVFPDGSMMARSATFAEFSLRHRMPLISGWSAFPEGGNLMSYGPNVLASWRRLAYFVDRIAKGARPADLPIELPTVVELVLNAKAAKALGIAIPQSVLLRADRVIE